LMGGLGGCCEWVVWVGGWVVDGWWVVWVGGVDGWCGWVLWVGAVDAMAEIMNVLGEVLSTRVFGSWPHLT
jgi:hypothetical protein